MELQAQRHNEQLHMMCELFKVQLKAVQEATREAAHDKVWVSFAGVRLGQEAQDVAAEEEEEGELPRAAVENME